MFFYFSFFLSSFHRNPIIIIENRKLFVTKENFLFVIAKDMVQEKIKAFVQKTLGCGCPEEVFEYIDCLSNIPLNNILLRNRINIGNKLLIFVVEANNFDSLEETLISLVDAGIRERDSGKFNRFRLVIAVDNPSFFKQHAYDIFDTLAKDERVHLHIIHKDDLTF